MKTSKIILSLLSLSVLAFSSCNKYGLCVKANGPVETRAISIASFSEIDLTEDAEVYVHQGKEQSVTVTAAPNIIDILDNSVIGNRWEIDFDRHCAKNYHMVVDITIPKLTNIVISGDGNIFVDDFTGKGMLDLTLSGSGKIVLNKFDGITDINALLTGSGSIVAQNKQININNLDIGITGSGYFKGFGIETKNCDALLTGSGDIKTTVTENLLVKITGSGDVYYKGNPSVNSKITGSGDVRNVN